MRSHKRGMHANNAKLCIGLGYDENSSPRLYQLSAEDDGRLKRGDYIFAQDTGCGEVTAQFEYA